MWLWTSSLNFVLAILQLAFNLLVLVAVASDRKLHTSIHLLSTSLWVCNAITAIVTIFFSLNPSQCLEVACFHAKQLQITDLKTGRTFIELERFPALTTAILLNSTVSLLTLLTIGFVHALARHNYHLSRSQLSRLIGSSWLLVTMLLLSDFFLIRLSHSFVLAVPFHLALLSVFLVLNLIIHPLNLIQLLIAQRRNPEASNNSRLMKDCATTSLWLLLNCLSFIIIVMMVAWDSRDGRDQLNSIMGIEVAAFSVHCVANPLIAVIRDRQLERSLTRIIMRTKRTRPNHEEDLVIALMRDPPPPYTE